MNRVIEKIEEIGIIPVINIENPETAVPLADALIKGGIPLIEVTNRSDASFKSVENIKKAFPDMLVGVGTVLCTGQVDEAISSGADFIVSPGYNSKTVLYCQSVNIPIIPGCVTTSELEIGIEAGIKVFKYFPAEQMGGLNAIELLGGPFSKIKFIPTGGITYEKLPSYMASTKVIACGGSYMAKADLIKACAWNVITANCKKAIDISLGFELAHIGLNHDNQEQANKTAQRFSDLFRVPLKDGNSSVFAGTFVECMKTQYKGKNGHIGFYTNSVARAIFYFTSKGIEIDEKSLRRDNKDNIASVYLAGEILGFAVHVVRK